MQITIIAYVNEGVINLIFRSTSKYVSNKVFFPSVSISLVLIEVPGKIYIYIWILGYFIDFIKALMALIRLFREK